VSAGLPPVAVLARTPSWAILAKPARLACHRSAEVRDRVTLMQAVRPRLHRPIHLVHRLDRGVSGCLLVAFDPATCTRLHAALVGPGSRKRYVALVRGWWRWDDPLVVDTPLAEEGGVLREARTTIRALARSHEPRCSLVAVEPETGRWHQVRRHCRDAGHPILGDTTHGDGRENRVWRERGVGRLALHQLVLDLGVEEDGLRVAAWCPPAADLVAVWSRLPGWAGACAAEPRLAAPPLDLDAGDAASGIG
jgi:tRNA pseudouridine65 synthase